jgi:hypothetical protein
VRENLAKEKKSQQLMGKNNSLLNQEAVGQNVEAVYL